MQKLNELVELAKKATPGRNHDRLDSCGGGIKYQCLGDDGSLVLQCDHKNDKYGFIGPKSLEDEAFFLACKPETILAIAAEFRALEQRAESVEAEVQSLTATAQPVSDKPSLKAMMRALDAFYADESVPEAAMMKAFRILLADVMPAAAPGGQDD